MALWPFFVLGLIGRILADGLVDENGVHTAVFLSPKITMGPGSVVNQNYFNVDFPKGHIALKSLDAEVVDEAGNSIPLHETYLHHWIVIRYQQKKGGTIPGPIEDWWMHPSEVLVMGNSGVCQDYLGHDILGQYFGLGSETRKTFTRIPEPYGIVIGNPSDVVPGFEEKWMLNVHAIDTRDVEDKLGCTECRCDLYDVSSDLQGQPLDPNYRGGFLCCHDGAQCRLKVKENESLAPVRGLYMKYTVRWVKWSPSAIPVRIYIFDVTDTWNKENDRKHQCSIEYNVEPSDGFEDFSHVNIATSPIPKGGNIVYAVAHQHTGGTGSTLYKEDGRVICSSLPIYGTGTEPGNEAGHVVGMSTCYPEPGSITLSDGEILTLVSNYSRTELHTGVMGQFYILVADHTKQPLHTIALQIRKPFMSVEGLCLMGLFGFIPIIAAGIAYRSHRLRTEDGYQSM